MRETPKMILQLGKAHVDTSSTKLRFHLLERHGVEAQLGVNSALLATVRFHLCLTHLDSGALLPRMLLVQPFVHRIFLTRYKFEQSDTNRLGWGPSQKCHSGN